jgi:hypothetical protein
MEQAIPDDTRVFRCVRADAIVVDDVTGRERPKSSVFSDHKEDGAMSVYLEDEILADGKKPEDLLQLWPGYRICYLTVGQLRELGQVIVRASIEEFPGHANVTDAQGKRSNGLRTKLAKRAEWLA